MKNTMFRLIAMLSLTLALGAINVFAQTNVNELRMSISFEFNAGGQTLPAGEYSIRPISRDHGRRTIQIQNLSTKESVLVATMPVQTIAAGKTGSELLFNQYGEQKFLSRVQLGDDNYRVELPKSKNERELARNAKNNAEVIKTVTLKFRKDVIRTSSAGE